LGNCKKIHRFFQTRPLPNLTWFIIREQMNKVGARCGDGAAITNAISA
jgi:hypothetical protein